MNAAYYLLAIAAGLGITLQTTLNGQLAKGVGGDSVAAALFSFTAGAVCLGVFSLMRGGIVASLAAIPAQPWWSLLGGLLGAGALLSYVVLAPKIGLSALLGWLDVVLLPALAVFIGLTIYALWRRQRNARNS